MLFFYFLTPVIKQNLYDIAEKHLVLGTAPRKQVEAWATIEADVRQKHNRLNILIYPSFVASIDISRHF